MWDSQVQSMASTKGFFSKVENWFQWGTCTTFQTLNHKNFGGHCNIQMVEDASIGCEFNFYQGTIKEWGISQVTTKFWDQRVRRRCVQDAKGIVWIEAGI